MEKVAVRGASSAGSRRELRIGACAAIALCVACPAVFAQDAVPAADMLAAEVRNEAPLRVQVEASSLPRLEAQESGFHAPRVDVSLLPTARSGFGPVLGMSGFSAPQGLQPAGLQPLRPSVDLGVRYSHRLQSQQQIDVTAWRRMHTDADAYTLIQRQQPVYGARVEMNLGAKRKSGLAASLGFIGLQLESGARISIKRKDGRPMIYYRTTF